MPSGLKLFALAASACGLLSAQPAPRPRKAPDFQREIRPILSDHCFQCHGPDSKSRMAGLRLDLKDSALAARKSGAAIVPSSPEKSLLYQRITAADPARRMPPDSAHKPLAAPQIALLKRWIEDGAPWSEHWSFRAPEKLQPPAVKAVAWPRNPIDRFILARLESLGLTPAPAADRRTLIRRAALDLTGLPPSPAELEAFLKDLSPNAYERMLDRYLASPRFGEHRARYWLDAARYGDTHGIHIDNYREIWPYRDWVINAYNRNLPFDVFTSEQLAGDLLPKPTLEQRIATGFQRCNVTTNEAGIIEDEYAEIYAKDRADTTGAVWLGLTVGCATCHDHKFDPITQKDFYALGAFFRNTTQKVMDDNIPDTPPVILVPTPADREDWDKISARLASIKSEMAALRETVKSGDRNLDDISSPLDPKDELFHLNTPLEFPTNQGLPIHDAPRLDAEKPFSVAIRFYFPKAEQGYVIASQQNRNDKNRGWVIDVGARVIGLRLIGDDGRNIEIRAGHLEQIQHASWNHLVVTYDGSRHQSGLGLYLNGRAIPTQGRGNQNVELPGSIGVDTPLILGRALAQGAIDDFRIYDRVVIESEARLLHEWSAGDPNAVLTHFLLNDYEPFRKLAEEQTDLNLEAKAIARRGAVTLVMQENADSTPFAHVLYRGAYDQKRQRVDATTPAILPPMPADLPRNRLGFAKWLFLPENPLTARVTVNRMWQEIFGAGLVKTADDFGSQGEAPVNQPLLDWLAVDFRENGWDVKRFYKQLLMSATYRQSAAVTPDKLAKDPENRSLSRGPRFRMDGEMVRDYALAASGLLAPQIGGPSVKPYQPEGVWEAVAMVGSNTRFYKPDKGDGLYRRSLYTFIKRSAPPASMDIFNAPTRENCTVRRERTNTPLQALATMNDVQFVEAAKELAGHAMQTVPGFDGRLDYFTTRLLARSLDLKERAIAKSSFDDFRAYYAQHSADAEKLLGAGEKKPDPSLPAADYAAYTMLVNQLMNLDEVLNK